MSLYPVIKPTDLHEVASTYRYDAEAFYALERPLWEGIQNYAGDYGQTVIEHLNRTAAALETFLAYRGDYHPQTIKNLGAAFKLHDAGKVLQSPDLWNLPGKPDKDTKLKRSEHASLGPVFLNEVLSRTRNLQQHPHLSVIDALMRYHHERVNGIGPQKLSGNELGTVLEIAGIMDAIDGKRIPRQQRESKPLPDVLREMTGLPAYTPETKHKGEFRTPLLMEVIDYHQKKDPKQGWILPIQAEGLKPQQTLAL